MKTYFHLYFKMTDFISRSIKQMNSLNSIYTFYKISIYRQYREITQELHAVVNAAQELSL